MNSMTDIIDGQSFFKDRTNDNYWDFENKWLPLIKEKYDVHYCGNYYDIESNVGVLQYFPTMDRLLNKTTITWHNNGLKWIINNIL
jgi:hypothetical protein